MMTPGPEMIVLAIKGAGAAIGSFFSVIIVPPKTKSEALKRVVISLVFGVIFADLVRERMHIADTAYNTLAAATIGGVFSWVVIAAAIRLVDSVTWQDLPWPFKKK